MNNEVSLCMIVKDEEKNLKRCLDSVKDIVDEMIIVDTGSSDNTVAIAESFGAKVYHFKWTNSFSEARNESLKYAKKDWILIMDGDDEFCNEDKDKFLELKGSLIENGIYFFETLNYCGDFPDSNNISINLNPRLFKNKYGFIYSGAVHNQLINSTNTVKDINVPIRIYHYGYLDSIIRDKKKRERNISLLTEQLNKNPDNKYANFNLGNEYFALGDMINALKFYYRAYENFNPDSGYGFILILRMVITNYNIGNYEKALSLADIGLSFYPTFTDLHYFKGIIYKLLNMPTLAIRALEKCIELGEPVSELKFLYGTGSFKSHYLLASIYMEFKDYDKAYQYYIEAIKSKRDFTICVYRIAHILKAENTPIEKFKNTIESFFSDYPNAYYIIADLFYNEGYFETALEYIKICEDNGLISENVTILKAKSLLRAGKFEEYNKIQFFAEESAFYFQTLMYKVIGLMLTDKSEDCIGILEKLSSSSLQNFDNKMLQVYTQLLKLFTKETTAVLSEDETEKDFTDIIFEVLEIFLVNQKFDEFELVLNMLNLISDKSVLLRLGKLYFKYGYRDMAKKEIIRSIKEFEVFDFEGLDILR